MKSHERVVDVRLDTPAIEGVQRTGNQKQTISEVSELFHSKIRMAQPSKAAKSSFRNKIINPTLPQPSPSRQNFL
jgi:hypothetical protein